MDMGDIRPAFSKSPRNVPRNERFCPLLPTSDGVLSIGLYSLLYALSALQVSGTYGQIFLHSVDPAETRAVKATSG